MAYDIILIYPPITEGRKTTFSFPPLGILYVATFLKQKGFTVKVVDAVIENILNMDIVEEVIRENPLMMGISSMTCQIQNSIKIAEGIKSVNPNIKIAIGGPHISSTIDDLYNFSDKFDFLVYGEGEYTFYELLKTVKSKVGDLKDIKGLIYKEDKESVIVNPPREHIKDLDSLPFPDLSLVDIKKYDSFYALSKPFTGLIASRGCPFSCTFCDAYATHGKKLRLRSAKNIVDEIEHDLNKFGIRQFMIKDSTFTINKEWVKNICNELLSRDLRINWTCNTRVDMIEKELFNLMKKAGCYMVMLGIESGSQKVLDNIKKGVTVKQIEEGIKICKEVGIDTTGYFMVGNPGDEEGEVKKTIELAKKLDLDFANFGISTPYPNTELYGWAVEEGFLTDRNWYMKQMKFFANQAISGSINLPGLPVERQVELCRKANREFYFRPRYILSQIFKLRPNNLKRKFKSMLELIK